ncbi:hypothetical protein TNCV_582251 [Trichonephila clavipes]|nr:hypothetical protein TNCV_582251 [Trichonephila clavipes]
MSGVLSIFQRSETSRKASYTQYIGDGDSKGFLTIKEAKVYGNTEVEKLECVGHMQKQMLEKVSVLFFFDSVSLEEFVEVDYGNVCTVPIMTDKDFLEFVQSSKNIIDADSGDEKEMTDAASS